MSPEQEFMELFAYFLAQAGATGFEIGGEKYVLNFRRKEDQGAKRQLERLAKLAEQERRWL